MNALGADAQATYYGLLTNQVNRKDTKDAKDRKEGGGVGGWGTVVMLPIAR